MKTLHKSEYSVCTVMNPETFSILPVNSATMKELIIVTYYYFKKNDKTFQSKKHVSTATSVIFS